MAGWTILKFDTEFLLPTHFWHTLLNLDCHQQKRGNIFRRSGRVTLYSDRKKKQRSVLVLWGTAGVPGLMIIMLQSRNHT